MSRLTSAAPPCEPYPPPVLNALSIHTLPCHHVHELPYCALHSDGRWGSPPPPPPPPWATQEMESGIVVTDAARPPPPPTPLPMQMHPHSPHPNEPVWRVHLAQPYPHHMQAPPPQQIPPPPVHHLFSYFPPHEHFAPPPAQPPVMQLPPPPLPCMQHQYGQPPVQLPQPHWWSRGTFGEGDFLFPLQFPLPPRELPPLPPQPLQLRPPPSLIPQPPPPWTLGHSWIFGGVGMVEPFTSEPVSALDDDSDVDGEEVLFRVEHYAPPTTSPTTPSAPPPPTPTPGTKGSPRADSNDCASNTASGGERSPNTRGALSTGPARTMSVRWSGGGGAFPDETPTHDAGPAQQAPSALDGTGASLQGDGSGAGGAEAWTLRPKAERPEEDAGAVLHAEERDSGACEQELAMLFAGCTFECKKSETVRGDGGSDDNATICPTGSSADAGGGPGAGDGTSTPNPPSVSISSSSAPPPNIPTITPTTIFPTTPPSPPPPPLKEHGTPQERKMPLLHRNGLRSPKASAKERTHVKTPARCHAMSA